MATPASTITIEEEALQASHRECFACGISSACGLHLHFAVDVSGVARADWLPTEAFRSYPDRAHGGILATLLDSAMVHALFALGIAGVTVEMKIRFKNAVRVNEAVQVSGWVESSRHGIHYCHAEVHQAGAMAAHATAKFMARQG